MAGAQNTTLIPAIGFPAALNFYHFTVVFHVNLR